MVTAATDLGVNMRDFEAPLERLKVRLIMWMVGLIVPLYVLLVWLWIALITASEMMW